MALFVCKCLNLKVESDKLDNNVDFEKLNLSPAEQRDIFFNENLVKCADSDLKTRISQQALLGERNVGRWIVYLCLACKQTTHAILQDNTKTVLINKTMMTTQEQIDAKKKSSNFSPVFNLLVPEIIYDLGMKENFDTSNLSKDTKLFVPLQQAIGSLNTLLRQTLQQQLEELEESVQQFRNKKYSEYEAFKDKAQQDHKILASIISKTRGTIENEWQMDTDLDNGPLSPLLPLQRRRLSSIKDAKKLIQFKQTHKILPPEEDSLDPEDIFDLEEESHRDMGSDQDDYDSDSGSHDEGIHIVRSRGADNNNQEIARSLPINMPIIPKPQIRQEHDFDDEGTRDIAASIKALAKSVHGDVFDLPRPRFSTQI